MRLLIFNNNNNKIFIYTDKNRLAGINRNLVPRACDPREGNEGSGIIRFREDSDWPLKWMRSSILGTIPGFRCHSYMSIPVFCVSPH